MNPKNRCFSGVFLLLVVFGYGCAGQSSSKSTMAKEIEESQIVFQKKMHDFGLIQSGEEVGALFGFVNEGDAPIVIQKVVAGCGCTAVNYSKTPVLPLEKGFVEVVFDARGRHGQQHKSVRVFANIPEESILLTVTAVVK